MTTTARLNQINQVIERGPFKDNWPSLCNHRQPSWYKNARFGIFVCWGIYSVPAKDDWYPRNMYIESSPIHEYHEKTYGSVDEFGYKDIIPLFKGESFNPNEWVDLFIESGARYVQPIAIFHDGYPMYNSDIMPLNSATTGPKVDFLKKMKEAIESKGLHFCTSTHYAENYWYYNGGRRLKSDILDPDYSLLYGPSEHEAVLCDEDWDPIFQVNAPGPDTDFLEHWLVQTCEIVDKYQPKVIFFDWWIQNLAFKPYLKKFAAYYYNKADEWGHDVTITYKHHAFAYTSATLDVERGQLTDISPNVWQCDTSIARNSWCYTDHNDFKDTEEIICELIDIVSKNGNLLLNVGPKADGTICDEEIKVLREIGKWLDLNGEGIYETTYWHIYGEGPTVIPDGHCTDTQKKNFTEKDVRYTYKDGYVYAFLLSVPANTSTVLHALKRTHRNELELGSIELLSTGEELFYTREDSALHIRLPENTEKGLPICLKIQTL